VKYIGLLGIAVLAGCNTPPLGFAGSTPERVTVGQSTFDVRIKEDRAHALRINREFAPNIAFVAGRASKAIAQVSGCTVVPGSLVGDPIFITADLDCATAPASPE